MNIKICNEVTALIVISHNVILIENAEAQLEQNTQKKKKCILHTFWKKRPCCNLVLYTSNNSILKRGRKCLY